MNSFCSLMFLGTTFVAVNRYIDIIDLFIGVLDEYEFGRDSKEI